MALYSGVTGNIKITPEGGTATTLVHMSNWSVEVSKDIIEVVSFGNTYKEKVPSIKDWSASSDGTTDFASAGGQAMLLEAFENGKPVEAAFYLNDTTFFTGTAFIESLSIELAADGASTISISLAGSNAVVLTNPTT